MKRAWLPPTGGHLEDERGSGRTLRVSHHAYEDAPGEIREIVVVSLWRGGICTGSFRLPADEVEDLVALLRAGADDTIGVASEI